MKGKKKKVVSEENTHTLTHTLAHTEQRVASGQENIWYLQWNNTNMQAHMSTETVC